MFSVDPNMMQRGGMGPGPQQPTAPVQPQPKAPVLQQHAAVAQNYGLPQPKAPPAYGGKPLTGPQGAWNSQQWDEYHRQQAAKGVDQNALYNQGQVDAFAHSAVPGMDAYGRPTNPNGPLANPYGTGNAAAMAHAKAQAINDPNSFEYFYAKQWGDPRQNAPRGWQEDPGIAAQQWQARAGDRGGFNLDPFSGHFNVGPTSYGQAPERGSPEDLAAAMQYWKQKRVRDQAQRQFAQGQAAYIRPDAPYVNPFDNYGGK